MARRHVFSSKVYMVSVATHLAVAALVILIPPRTYRQIIAISIAEPPKAKKEEKKQVPPPESEHRAERASRAPSRNTAAPHHVAPPLSQPGSEPFMNIGLALDSSADGGSAIPVATAESQSAPPVAMTHIVRQTNLVRVRTRVLEPRPIAAECTAPILPARPVSLARAWYTESARRAGVEGRILIRLTIDGRGRVARGELLRGLGYGLDDVALEAARGTHFAPATRCGEPVESSFVLALRFERRR